MEISFTLPEGITLQMAAGANHNNHFPTARIQKGLLLYCDGQDLSEEAVGFGVPVIKRGLQTIFPGQVELVLDPASPTSRFTARYQLFLEERITKPGSEMRINRWVYSTKNILAEMIRRFPRLRRLFTAASNQLRSSLGWQTTYEPSGFSTELTLSYVIDPPAGKLSIALASLGGAPSDISEIAVMSEQGAHHFDQYQDSLGNKKQGEHIGCWDEVTAPQAAFVSTSSRLSFGLSQVQGARLFAGRELIGSRLAWSGFGYTFPPTLEHFSFDLVLRRLA